MFPSERNSDLSAWAHAYAERGWPVFPLIPRDKRPIPRDGFKSATTDHDQLDQWWKFRPDANIGLATGHAFDVLDVDGEAGVEFLRDTWSDLGLGVYRHDGPLSLTGKGWHMLFAATGEGNRANLGGDTDRQTKLDYRGLGGYIVAPPSIHPLGHRYQWDATRGPDAEIPPAPEWLLGLLNRDDNPVKATKDRRLFLPNGVYEQLMRDGLIPADQLPRATRKRFERPDIREVCADLGIALRRRGGYYVARCPYHKDDTPSMAVYPRNNTFYCYGCQKHGDSYDLQQGTYM